VDDLEKAPGMPVNYEDPRFICPDEIQGNVPRGRTPALEYRFNHLSQTAVAFSPANSLIVTHEESGLPGRFTVKYVGTAVTVQPIAARGSGCKWSPVTAAMETKISFDLQTIDASEAVPLILSTLTKRLAIKVGLVDLPLMDFIKRNVLLAAYDEPANVVLEHLFDQLAGVGRIQWSYRLLYQPGLNYYVMVIHTVPQVTLGK
jgi:hypothetical protein